MRLIAPALLAVVLLCSSCSSTQTSSVIAGQSIRDCRDCPELIVIPAGRFTMGSPADEAGRQDDESPQRTVAIRAFAMGRFDVTLGQWAAFVAATHRPIASGCEWTGFPQAEKARASWRNLGFEQADDHPVVCVSWNDAQDFVRWMSERTKHAYRLPTEAEWEYAARAGSTTAYPWGTAASHDQANYGADECCAAFKAGRDQWLYTSPVGSFPANAFGLYDMIGNAWQWVEDCYAESYAAVPNDGSAFVQAPCARRSLRGGTWGDMPALIRSAARNWSPPPHWNPAWDYRSGGVGFRVVRTLD